MTLLEISINLTICLIELSQSIVSSNLPISVIVLICNGVAALSASIEWLFGHPHFLRLTL
jgi:hypothetical protein